MNTYFKRSADKKRCDNCGCQYADHQLAGVDRDGQLYECPIPGARAALIASNKQETGTLRMQLLATIALADGEGYSAASEFIRRMMRQDGMI